jgi:DNA-binding NarL/FixJ family response regulator
VDDQPVVASPGRPTGSTGPTRAKVLVLAAQGLTGAQIARELGISQRAIHQHLWPERRRKEKQ